MGLEIYWISGSAPAWRVLLTLEAKGLSYNSRVLRTDKKEQKEPWFLELNPRGQIPLLRDGDLVVSESLAVMHYLDSKYPSPRLFGEDPRRTAKIEQSVHEILAYVDAPVANFVQPVFRGKIDANRTSMEDAAHRIKAELAALDESLGSVTWLAGKDYSAADVVFTPTLQRLLRAIEKESRLAKELGLGELAEAYPAVEKWNRHVQSLPSFDATFPPHWRS